MSDAVLGSRRGDELADERRRRQDRLAVILSPGSVWKTRRGPKRTPNTSGFRVVRARLAARKRRLFRGPVRRPWVALFENYRLRTLFYCGKLDFLPHHLPTKL